MVLEAPDAIRKWRDLMGATDPAKARRGHAAEAVRHEHRQQRHARVRRAGDGGVRDRLLLPRDGTSLGSLPRRGCGMGKVLVVVGLVIAAIGAAIVAGPAARPAAGRHRRPPRRVLVLLPADHLRARQRRAHRAARAAAPLMIRPYRSILPRIDPSAFVDQSAQVIGDVEIGAESSAWMNVVIRGDVNWIRIGRRTNIQDGSIVHVMRGTHPTAIGDEVTVGHGVILHGCTIHDRCLIGMGAILLNGVEVGESCIVAAGTLLPEGMRVPPRSLVVGHPGQGAARADRRGSGVDRGLRGALRRLLEGLPVAWRKPPSLRSCESGHHDCSHSRHTGHPARARSSAGSSSRRRRAACSSSTATPRCGRRSSSARSCSPRAPARRPTSSRRRCTRSPTRTASGSRCVPRRRRASCAPSSSTRSSRRWRCRRSTPSGRCSAASGRRRGATASSTSWTSRCSASRTRRWTAR